MSFLYSPFHQEFINCHVNIWQYWHYTSIVCLFQYFFFFYKSKYILQYCIDVVAVVEIIQFKQFPQCLLNVFSFSSSVAARSRHTTSCTYWWNCVPNLYLSECRLFQWRRNSTHEMPIISWPVKQCCRNCMILFAQLMQNKCFWNVIIKYLIKC